VVTFLDAASEKTLRSTVALTATRGRGKVRLSIVLRPRPAPDRCCEASHPCCVLTSTRPQRPHDLRAML